MKNELKELKELLGYYLNRSILIEKKDLGNPSFLIEDLKEVELNIENKLRKIFSGIKLPKGFLELVKKLINEEQIKLQIVFAEPYLEDFMNRIFLDLEKYRLLENKELEKLKEEYSKEEISFY